MFGNWFDRSFASKANPTAIVATITPAIKPVFKGGDASSILLQLQPCDCILQHGPQLHSVMNDVTCVTRPFHQSFNSTPRSEPVRLTPFADDETEFIGK